MNLHTLQLRSLTYYIHKDCTTVNCSMDSEAYIATSSMQIVNGTVWDLAHYWLMQAHFYPSTRDDILRHFHRVQVENAKRSGNETTLGMHAWSPVLIRRGGNNTTYKHNTSTITCAIFWQYTVCQVIIATLVIQFTREGFVNLQETQCTLTYMHAYDWPLSSLNTYQ